MSRQGRRHIRTVLVGTLSLGMLVWLAVERFEVPPQEMLELSLVTGLTVFLVITLAGTAALIWIGLRQFRRRRHDR